MDLDRSCERVYWLTCNYRNVVLSRKRKLSELYFATVSLGGIDSPGCAPGDELYSQQEAAFLDANDITKYAYSSWMSPSSISEIHPPTALWIEGN